MSFILIRLRYDYRCRCTQVNIQATVDHKHCFTSFEMGWPGSVPDMKVWKQSHLWVHRHQYVKNGWYILVGKGSYYCLSGVYVISDVIQGIHPLPMLFTYKDALKAGLFTVQPYKLFNKDVT